MPHVRGIPRTMMRRPCRAGYRMSASASRAMHGTTVVETTIEVQIVLCPHQQKAATLNP
jgi:hypothetical protein